MSKILKTLFKRLRSYAVDKLCDIVSRPRLAPFGADRYKVCIYKPDRLGDFILSLGVIRAVIEKAGEGNVVLVISPYAREIASLQFPTVKQIVLTPFAYCFNIRGLRAFLSDRFRLGRISVDTILCLRHQRVRAQYCHLGWIRNARTCMTIGCPGYDSPKYFTCRRNVRTIQYPRIPEGNLALDQIASMRLVQRCLHIELTPESATPSLTQRYSASSYVLVTPFSSAKVRDYPSDQLVQAVAEIAKVRELKVLFTSSSDKGLATMSLVEQLRNRGVSAELAVTPNWDEYSAAVEKACSVITMDTATAHIATALDKATVVIAGDGDGGQCGPWRRSGKQLWIKQAMPCAGCRWVCTQPNPYCITSITPHAIVRAFDSVFSVYQLNGRTISHN